MRLLLTITFGCLFFLSLHAQKSEHSVPEKVLGRMELSDVEKSTLQELYADYRKQVDNLRKEKNMKAYKGVKEDHLERVMEVLSGPSYKAYTTYLDNSRGSASRNKVKKQLALTADQNKKFDAANEAFSKMVSKLRSDYEGDRAGFRKAMQPLREKRKSLMQSFLTAEQYEKYVELSASNGHGHSH